MRCPTTPSTQQYLPPKSGYFHTANIPGLSASGRNSWDAAFQVKTCYFYLLFVSLPWLIMVRRNLTIASDMDEGFFLALGLLASRLEHITFRATHRSSPASLFSSVITKLVLHFSQQTSNKAKTSAVLGSDGPFPSASTAHMYTIRQASTWHWYYNLSLNTRLRFLLNDRAKTEPWQC